MDEARDAAVSMVLRSLGGALLCCCATVLTTALTEQVDELVQAAASQLADRYGATLVSTAAQGTTYPGAALSDGNKGCQRT